MTIESNKLGGNTEVSASVHTKVKVGTNLANSSAAGSSSNAQTNTGQVRTEDVATHNNGKTISESEMAGTANLQGKNAPQENASQQLEDKHIARLNDYVQSMHRRLEFSVDDTTNRTVVSVIDKDTQEVIRQIPSETALKLAQKLSSIQDPAGLLFEDRA